MGLGPQAKYEEIGKLAGELEEKPTQPKSHYAVIEEDAHRVRPLYPPSALGENSAWWCAQLEGKRVEVSGCVFSARYHGGAAVVAQSAKVLP